MIWDARSVGQFSAGERLEQGDSGFAACGSPICARCPTMTKLCNKPGVHMKVTLLSAAIAAAMLTAGMAQASPDLAKSAGCAKCHEMD